jgi:hypothetical protein
VQLRARDGRALLAESDDAQSVDGVDDTAPAAQEVDPHSLALGADLADALHEWARVADAVYRNGQSDESAAAKLISRRGQQLAGRIAAVMGRPVSYADPLTGEVTEIAVPDHEPTEHAPVATWWARQSEPAHRRGPATEPTPWATGLTVTGFCAVVVMIVVISLSFALGAASDWLALIANLVIALGLAPSVWLARHAPVWRWVAYGVVTGIVVAWITLLFTAL